MEEKKVRKPREKKEKNIEMEKSEVISDVEKMIEKVEEKVEEKPKRKEYLERADLNRLTLLKERKKIKDMEFEIFKKNLEISRLNYMIEEMKLQKLKEAYDKMAREVEDKRKLPESALNEYKEYVDKLTKEYNIEGKWAYDEFSGKIALLPN